MAQETTRPRVIEPHDGGFLDHIRTAIFALQLASELTRDEQQITEVSDVITELQTLLAEHARRRDSAIGMTPELQHVDRMEAKPGAEPKA